MPYKKGGLGFIILMSRYHVLCHQGYTNGLERIQKYEFKIEKKWILNEYLQSLIVNRFLESAILSEIADLLVKLPMIDFHEWENKRTLLINQF